MSSHSNPIAVRFSNPLTGFLVNQLTKIDQVSGIYQRWLDHGKAAYQRGDGSVPEGLALLDFCLRDLEVELSMALEGAPGNAVPALAQALDSIPKSGPLLIVCNHPLGALEGMLLTRLLARARPDLKVLVNELLMRIPEFGEIFIGVDVLNMSGNGGAAKNSQGLRRLHQHLAAGGASLIFPAGTVATLDLKNDTLVDAPWHPMIARLALKHQAACVPIYLHGRNPKSFYLAGRVHKRLRTALLGRAMLAHRGKTLHATVGKLIDSAEVAAIARPEALNQYLRLCCEQLGSPAHVLTTLPQTANFAEIGADVAQAELVAQIAQLQQFQVAEHRDFAVYCAPYEQLGCVMRQIAISRERTFREVSEGTGKELDEDQFDPYYWHLWVWDRKQNQMVGGYRITKVDELLAKAGLNQLYSRSLYQYDQAFLDQLGPAIEVGRSFVCPAYQRQPHALDLLWKGIGGFVVRNPGYHTLFGCVSISQEYSHVARRLLADTFLYHYGAEASLRQAVRASAPLEPRRAARPSWTAELLASLVDIPMLNKLLGRLSEGRTIPILIRHYLALNGKFISFTVNHGFNQSLDGLILVDLREAPAKYIDRYFGETGAADFRSLHGVADAA